MQHSTEVHKETRTHNVCIIQQVRDTGWDQCMGGGEIPPESGKP